jgi:hypothetical protein
MESVAENERTRLIQVKLTEDAYRRIKVAAAKKDVPPGQIISELAGGLPMVQDAA